MYCISYDFIKIQDYASIYLFPWMLLDLSFNMWLLFSQYLVLLLHMSPFSIPNGCVGSVNVTILSSLL